MVQENKTRAFGHPRSISHRPDALDQASWSDASGSLCRAFGTERCGTVLTPLLSSAQQPGRTQRDRHSPALTGGT
eukprot:CAMPEP_0181201200 /NCGR_PEP_ID=MMETSP1096-20121128/18178_1 /TAXON_ID=156174 ORGANISM="Chrysochromulina ericina, Strain CCMP281" /NCGR_SAMPLE_ID=MMETSP1096 /ASSEMBLY_ACC=CAM_ASM_000453 /LENGTH=74 /DNA_ID=CAMNT_0023291623 /DNA_START=262 /DNA_END=486 /DNA_ORIENTATION=-